MCPGNLDDGAWPRNCPFHVPEGGLTQCPHREGHFRGRNPFLAEDRASCFHIRDFHSMGLHLGTEGLVGKRRNARGHIYLCLTLLSSR